MPQVMLEERKRFRKAGVIRLRSQNSALQKQLESSREAHSAAVKQIEGKQARPRQHQHQHQQHRMGSQNRNELMQAAVAKERIAFGGAERAKLAFTRHGSYAVKKHYHVFSLDGVRGATTVAT